MISFLDYVVYILIYTRGLSTNLSLLGGGGFDPRISLHRRCGMEKSVSSVMFVKKMVWGNGERIE